MGEPLAFCQIKLAPLQLVQNALLIGDIYACSDKPLEDSRVSCRNAHATDATNLSIRPHNPFREVEPATFRKHLLNSLQDILPILVVDERQIFLQTWRLGARIEAVDSKQLRRPMIETG